ncbi:MAG TPA: tetratricopeptide repeat protein [Blastocatellia bacterium]|jgi:tetratricopeptide (TPR) repeat protein|nr:tetratricopeptide repeat protein [Blastocatellia bacterium]
MTYVSSLRKWSCSLALLLLVAGSGFAQIKGQFAEDFVAGRVPGDEEIAALEKEVAAHPDDFRLVRKLGKGYFFQYFGEGRASSASKARLTLERALKLHENDAEALVYLGGLDAVIYERSKDEGERQAAGRLAVERLKKAQQLAPANGAVLSVAAASYITLDDSFKTAPLAAEAMERLRAGMGPMFSRFSHHGQQRILLTQGQAYIKMGEAEKARACLEEGLKVDPESVEATMIRAALGKLK